MLVLLDSVRSLGATQATQAGQRRSAGRHEFGDGEDDEIAASPADDGSHEEYVGVRQDTRRSGMNLSSGR